MRYVNILCPMTNFDHV